MGNETPNLSNNKSVPGTRERFQWC